jgi:hypothetical protein
VYRIAHLDLDLFALAHHSHVGTAKLTQQIERWLRLLPQRQTVRVLLTALLDRLLDIFGNPVETVRRAGTVDPLMRALMVVVVNPMLKPAARVGKRRKDRLLEKLPPDRLPEALDLSQRHRMMRRAADVLHTLLAQHLLEARLPAPGHELPPVVRQDLAWCTPLTDCAFQHLEYGVGFLLPKQSPANDVTRVIVDDADEVHRVHPLQLKREDVDLPHRVRARALESSDLRRTATRLGRWVAKAGVVDHRPHRLGADLDTLVTTKIVADPAHSAVRVGLACLDDLLAERRTLLRGAPTANSRASSVPSSSSADRPDSRASIATNLTSIAIGGDRLIGLRRF